MFHCQFCVFETVSLTSHVNHHKFHRNITRYSYCGFNKCTKFFPKNVYLTKHLIRAHGLMQSKNQRTIIRDATCTSNERCKYMCSIDICKKEFDNFSKLVKHLKFHIKKKDQIMCPYPQCKNKYTVVSSFTGHMSKMHRNYDYNTDNVRESHDNDDATESTSQFFEPLNKVNGSVVLPNNYRELALEVNDQLNVNSIELEDVDNKISYNTAVESNLFVENVAQFYLKLECQYLLPATTIQYITSEISKMHEETQEIIKKNLTERFAIEDMSQQQIAIIVF